MPGAITNRMNDSSRASNPKDKPIMTPKSRMTSKVDEGKFTFQVNYSIIEKLNKSGYGPVS